jgi:hypothetical protein
LKPNLKSALPSATTSTIERFSKTLVAHMASFV